MRSHVGNRRNGLPQVVQIKQYQNVGEIVQRNECFYLTCADVGQIPLVIASAAYAPIFVWLFFARTAFHKGWDKGHRPHTEFRFRGILRNLDKLAGEITQDVTAWRMVMVLF